MKITCIVCKKEFDSNISNQKYCSHICRDYNTKTKHPKHKDLTLSEFAKSRQTPCKKCNNIYDKSEFHMSCRDKICRKCVKDIADANRKELMNRINAQAKKHKTCPVCEEKHNSKYIHCSIECWKLERDRTSFASISGDKLNNLKTLICQIGLDNITNIEITYDSYLISVHGKDSIYLLK
ncbi:MAG: hypothetical protein ACRCX2_03855 [Paraclostridium sp.]